MALFSKREFGLPCLSFNMNQATALPKIGKGSWLMAAAALVFLVSGAVELSRFTLHAVQYSRLGIYEDSTLYFAMGRALLNGLQLYTDLFETKPPGVFWLSALSLRVAAGDGLYRLLQGAGLVLLPGVLSAFTWQAYRRQDWAIQLLYAAFAFLFGAAMASFVLSRSVGYQTEGFGVAAATLSLALFASRSETPKAMGWKTAASALCFAVAVLLKEPFAVCLLGGFVLLARTKQDLADAAKVLALGAGMWLAILVVSGSAHGYFSVYLPEVFSGRILKEQLYTNYAIDRKFFIYSPPWLRGFHVEKLLADLRAPAYAFVPGFPVFGLALLALFLTYSTLGAGEPRIRWHLIGTAAALCVIRFINLAFMLEQVLAYFPLATALKDGFFLGRCLLLLGYGVAAAAGLILVERRLPGFAWRVTATAVALYLGSVAVAMGGDFFAHHFLFAVPVYIAGYLSFAQRAAAQPRGRWALAIMSVSAGLLILNALDLRRYDAPAMRIWNVVARTNPELIATADRLDGLLAACHFERYFLARPDADGGLNRLQALTRHSPYQLQYGLWMAFPTDKRPHSPFFQAKYLRDFAATPIVVTQSATGVIFPTPELQAAFEREFGTAAPACAAPFLPIPGLSLFFRHAEAMAK